MHWLGMAVTLVAGMVALLLVVFLKRPVDLDDLGSVSTPGSPNIVWIHHELRSTEDRMNDWSHVSVNPWRRTAGGFGPIGILTLSEMFTNAQTPAIDGAMLGAISQHGWESRLRSVHESMGNNK